MAIDDNRRDFPSAIGLVGRLRGAWQALIGQTAVVSNVGVAPAAGRSLAGAQALLIEQLIGGLPGAAIVLDREGRVIAFNEAATGIAPALRLQHVPTAVDLRAAIVVSVVVFAQRENA